MFIKYANWFYRTHNKPLLRHKYILCKPAYCVYKQICVIYNKVVFKYVKAHIYFSEIALDLYLEISINYKIIISREKTSNFNNKRLEKILIKFFYCKEINTIFQGYSISVFHWIVLWYQ